MGNSISTYCAKGGNDLLSELCRQLRIAGVAVGHNESTLIVARKTRKRKRLLTCLKPSSGGINIAAPFVGVDVRWDEKQPKQVTSVLEKNARNANNVSGFVAALRHFVPEGKMDNIVTIASLFLLAMNAKGLLKVTGPYSCWAVTAADGAPSIIADIPLLLNEHPRVGLFQGTPNVWLGNYQYMSLQEDSPHVEFQGSEEKLRVLDPLVAPISLGAMPAKLEEPEEERRKGFCRIS